MNKGRISVFLCFLVMMFLMVMGCSSSSDEPAGSASLSSLNASGLNSLSKGNIPEAKAYFKAAVENYPGDTTNDGDTARFFYAGTRIAGINLNSDGNSADLNSVGDILDRAGCSAGGRNILNLELTMTCPKTLPANFPTGSEMQTFAYNVIRPELEAALVNLSTVSASFTRTWTEPISSKSYKSDHGDVLVLRAAIKGALAAIHIQYAYNLNADIDVEVNTTDNTVEDFLGGNVDFLKLKSSVDLTHQATAKTYLGQVADDLNAAIDWINTPTRNTVAYLINLNTVSATDINKVKAGLVAGKASLSAQATVYDFGTVSTADDIIIDLRPFFVGLDLRTLLPPFTGNTPGTFPDPTMGGIIVQGLGDANNNGIPDILEE